MFGIHISEGTAEGWFGKGKTSAILSIAMIVALTFGIAFGIFAAMNAEGETIVNAPSSPNAPVTPVVPTTPGPTAPTPVQTPPLATTSEPAPTGVVEITAEKLIKELLANPNKYKEGTALQISGTILKSRPFNDGYQHLGPVVENPADTQLTVLLILRGSITIEDVRLYNRFRELKDGDWIVVKGTFVHFNPVDRGGVLVENISLISVTPAK